jgi:hypothetical protein
MGPTSQAYIPPCSACGTPGVLYRHRTGKAPVPLRQPHQFPHLPDSAFPLSVIDPGMRRSRRPRPLPCTSCLRLSPDLTMFNWR